MFTISKSDHSDPRVILALIRKSQDVLKTAAKHFSEDSAHFKDKRLFKFDVQDRTVLDFILLMLDVSSVSDNFSTNNLDLLNLKKDSYTVLNSTNIKCVHRMIPSLKYTRDELEKKIEFKIASVRTPQINSLIECYKIIYPYLNHHSDIPSNLDNILSSGRIIQSKEQIKDKFKKIPKMTFFKSKI